MNKKLFQAKEAVFFYLGPALLRLCAGIALGCCFLGLFVPFLARPAFGASEAVPPAPLIFEERREFQGYVRRGMAEVAARLAAQSAAYGQAELLLARDEDLRFADRSGSGGLAAPLPLDGLAHMIFSTQVAALGVEGFPPRLQAVVQVRLTPPDNQRAALLEALGQPGKLELYAQILQEQRRLLVRYDQLAEDLLPRRPNEHGGQEEGHHIQGVVNEMLALDILLSLLPGYDDRWKQPERATIDLARAGTLASSNPLVLTALAEAELQMDRPVRALEFASRALERSPAFARAHDLKGTILLRQHLPVLAEESFTRAIELVPKNPVYFTHRAAARLVLEHLPDMCADFQSACGLGDCEGLQWGRHSGVCPNEGGAQ
ncbi:hypothetical protein LJC09_02695 [Desulfovibrio sp. OttesenSCG-928-F20]|nr:hypothetical protein [Desulfovibrio sp. OttesenSCG-928-F20]